MNSFDGITIGDQVRIDADLHPHRTGKVQELEVVATYVTDDSPKWVFAIIKSDHDGATVKVPTELLAVLS